MTVRVLAAASVAAMVAQGGIGAAAAAAAPGVTKLAPAGGNVAGGTAVTIIGRGFTGVTSVRFGVQDALEVRIDRDTDDLDQLTAFSPPWVPGAAKQVQVQVVGPTGSSSEQAGFTYFTGGFTDTVSSTIARRGHTATLLDDGRVLVDVVVDPKFGDAKNSEIYDPGGQGRPASWRATGAPKALRRGQTATLLPVGQVLLAGGVLDGSGPSVEIWDPRASATPVGGSELDGVWAPGAPMLADRTGHGAAYLPTAGKVLAVGGAVPGRTAVASAELFDPNAGTWSSAPSMHQARVDQTTTVLPDGRMLVAGGRDDSDRPLASAEIYDPRARKWTTTTVPMGAARYGHRAAALSDGRVLVVGGRGTDGTALGSAEIFDPVPGRWSAAGTLAVPRFGHTATSLPDGRVLVAGGRVTEGYGPGEPGIDSAEVYDPTSGSWGPTTPLHGARTDHTATVLGGPACYQATPPPTCGQVLVAGGGGTEVLPNGGATRPLASAELFDTALTPVPVVSRLEPANGPEVGGTRVHILGSYLFGGHRSGDPAAYFTVRFGTEPAASVEAVSDRELVAVSPTGRNRVDVTVSTDLGTSPKTSASQFVYGQGAWSPADACPSGGTCEGRADQTAVVLDPPACHAANPPARYPCGKVLLAGKSSRTFTDGVVTGDVVTSATAAFTPADAGRDIESTRYPLLNKIREVVNATTIKLARKTTAEPGDRFAITRTSGQVYDPQNGTWSAAAPMDDRQSDTVQTLTFTSTLLPDGRVLVAGGCCVPKDPQVGPDTAYTYDQLTLRSTVIYDPTADRWTPAAPMANGRSGHTATLLDGPACRGAAPPAGCGEVLVTGGLTNINYGGTPRSLVASTELYDPVHDSWRTVGPMSDLRAGHTASLLPDGDVLAVGGLGRLDTLPNDPDNNEAALYTAERFDLVAETWKPRPLLPSGERTALHTATGLNPPSCAAGRAPAGYPCGSVLVTGGSTDFDPGTYRATQGRQSVKLYDPAGDAWKPAPGLNLDRVQHTATLLHDGSVLLVGGAPSGQTAEIYDPATGSSRLTLPMSTYRTEPTTALLDAAPCGSRCGQVLVVGGRPPGSGFDFFPTPITTAELFTAAPFAAGLSPERGTSAGSTSVVITGSGLGDVTGVSFGGVPAARFTVDSASQVTAVTAHHPAGTGPVELTSSLWPGGAGLPGRAPPFTFTRSKPAAPADVHARSLSATAVEVTFSAVGSDADNPPPAARYQVRQATTPITDDATFAAATNLCDPSCAFSPPTIATPLLLTISNLAPATTYHYAVKALDPTGVPGGISNPASAATPALAPGPTPSSTSSTSRAPTSLPPTTLGPRTAPRTAAPGVVTRTGTPPPALSRLVTALPLGRPPVVVPTPASAPQAVIPTATPAAVAPKVLFTPAQQSNPPSTVRTRRVIPTWLWVLTGISVVVNLAVLGGYLNRRLRR